jgi:hypothetical protein
VSISGLRSDYTSGPGRRGARPQGDVAGEYTTSRRLVGTLMVATVAVALVTLAMAQQVYKQPEL